MDTRKSRTLYPKPPTSPLGAKLIDRLNVLKLHELDPSAFEERSSAPKTRKAFQDQFRRLREHLHEWDVANEFLDTADNLAQRRMAKVAVRNRKPPVKSTRRTQVSQSVVGSKHDDESAFGDFAIPECELDD